MSKEEFGDDHPTWVRMVNFVLGLGKFFGQLLMGALGWLIIYSCFLIPPTADFQSRTYKSPALGFDDAELVLIDGIEKESRRVVALSSQMYYGIPVENDWAHLSFLADEELLDQLFSDDEAVSLSATRRIENFSELDFWKYLAGLDDRLRRLIEIRRDNCVEEQADPEQVKQICLQSYEDRINKLDEALQSGLWLDSLVTIYNSKIITIPDHFMTDFASIPEWGQMILPPFDHYADAAVIHDYLYALGEEERRKTADKVFYLAMRDSGVPLWKRRVMHMSVRIGGNDGYGNPLEWEQAFYDVTLNARVPKECLLARPEKPWGHKTRFDELELRALFELGIRSMEETLSVEESQRLLDLKLKTGFFNDSLAKATEDQDWFNAYQRPLCKPQIMELAISSYIGREKAEVFAAALYPNQDYSKEELLSGLRDLEITSFEEDYSSRIEARNDQTAKIVISLLEEVRNLVK